MADEKETVEESLEKVSEEASLAEAQQSYDHMMKRIKTNIWGHSKTGLMALKANMQMLSTKSGMYARIPIHCKGDNCPYAESCITLAEGLAPEGEACPTEVALLAKKLKKYSDEFDLGGEDASPTDEALVSEIILMEIQMMRCQALMSQETNPIQTMVVGVSDGGDPIEQPQVSKTIEAYERFSKKRNEDYNLLLATRKDKKKDKGEDKKDDVFEMMEKATSSPGFYDIDKRPENIQDAEYTNTDGGNT